MNWLARLIISSAEKEYSRATKSRVTTWGFVLFEVLVPASVLVVAAGLAALAPPAVSGFAVDHLPAPARWALFVAGTVTGQVFIIWTAVHQIRFSGGTPAFKAPPKRLLVTGPYRLCRNPMIFGYLLYYYGLAVFLASPLGLFLFFPALHLLALYVIVAVEEVELEARFGDAYRDYKRRVNRMLPMPHSWRPRRLLTPRDSATDELPRTVSPNSRG